MLSGPISGKNKIEVCFLKKHFFSNAVYSSICFFRGEWQWFEKSGSKHYGNKVEDEFFYDAFGSKFKFIVTEEGFGIASLNGNWTSLYKPKGIRPGVIITNNEVDRIVIWSRSREMPEGVVTFGEKNCFGFYIIIFF